VDAVDDRGAEHIEGHRLAASLKSALRSEHVGKDRLVKGIQVSNSSPPLSSQEIGLIQYVRDPSLLIERRER
jgi:hypothetical protein